MLCLPVNHHPSPPVPPVPLHLFFPLTRFIAIFLSQFACSTQRTESPLIGGVWCVCYLVVRNVRYFTSLKCRGGWEGNGGVEFGGGGRGGGGVLEGVVRLRRCRLVYLSTEQ